MSGTLILLLALSAAPAPARPETAPRDDASTLCGLVASGGLSSLRWPDFSDYRSRLQSFYQPTGYSLAWTRAGQATDQARAVIGAFEDADSKGLEAEDYDGSRWADRLANLNGDGLARFDLAVTVTLMRYLSDLHLGRVNPGLFHAGFDLDGEKDDLPGFIRRRVMNAADVKAVLQGVEPPYQGYRRTEEALQRYIAMAREENVGSLPVPKKPIEPGGSYPAVAQLASRLRRVGDLSADAGVSPESNGYEEPLIDAVKRFQMRHGLDPDGRLGKATLAQLNTPLTFRVRQLQLTLERWRWVPHGFSRPPIVVNIPEFELRAASGLYTTELAMKVVVGRAYGHQTPVFASEMKYAIFRPYWNVPLSIQRAELMPKLDRDPAYLARNGFEVVTLQDKVVTKGVVDGATLGLLRSGKLRIRQTPGDKNALGLVKFVFPNEHSVYLHGTPATELFSKSRRDFSHGCIRVEHPEALAAWVLRDKPEWTPERIASAMHGTDTIQVTLEKPIPVLIVYVTAVVLEGGEARFFEDIYGQDAQIEALLAKGYPRPAWKPTSGAPARHRHE